MNKNSMIVALKRDTLINWDRIEDTNTSSHTCSHLNFDQEAKNMHERKDSIFNKW